jgi:hypothetical protein
MAVRSANVSLMVVRVRFLFCYLVHGKDSQQADVLRILSCVCVDLAGVFWCH